MKRVAAGLAVGAILGGTATAGASSFWAHTTKGITCKSGTAGIACVPTSGEGYGIGISRVGVLVVRVDTGRTIFSRYQP